MKNSVLFSSLFILSLLFSYSLGSNRAKSNEYETVEKNISDITKILQKAKDLGEIVTYKAVNESDSAWCIEFTLQGYKNEIFYFFRRDLATHTVQGMAVVKVNSKTSVLEKFNFRYEDYDKVPFIKLETKVTTQPHRDYVTRAANQDNNNSVFENKESAKIINESDFRHSSFETTVLKLDSIDKTLVLKKLFPGNYYKNNDGEYTVWICPTYPNCQFDSIKGFEILHEKFPYKEANFTTISGIYRYKLDNAEYCATTFSTSNNFPPTIYEIPGILGVAIFRKENTNWKLIFFDPAAAALGTYQNAGSISKVIKISNDKVGYCMFYADGGHGLDLSYENMNMFAITDNKFKNILSIDSFKYSEYTEEGTTPLTEWESEISVVDPTNKISIISCNQNGIVNQSQLSEVKFPKLTEYTSKYKKFKFEFNRTYRFNGTHYVLSNSKVSATSLFPKQEAKSESKAEKIEDYYFPDNGNNVSEFVYIDEKGNKTFNKSLISFVKLDENKFKTSTTNSVLEETRQELKDYKQDVKSYSTYLIKNGELLLVSEDFFNVKNGRREFATLNPSKVILKLPGTSKRAEWKIKDLSGDQYSCLSEFATVEIDGVKKKAIKLTKRIISEDSSTSWSNSVTYYVEGIGEWKLYMENTMQVARLLNRQYSTNKSHNGEMSQSSPFNRGEGSVSKQEKIENIQDGQIMSQNKVEVENYKQIVMNWNVAHNTNDMALFAMIFADEVNYYHTALSKSILIQKKMDLLKKYPDFNQQIKGEISTERLNENEVKCSFIKEVTINNKVSDYPSYLILKKTGENWKISVEGDLVTDKNIAKKKQRS